MDPACCENFGAGSRPESPFQAVHSTAPCGAPSHSSSSTAATGWLLMVSHLAAYTRRTNRPIAASNGVVEGGSLASSVINVDDDEAPYSPLSAPRRGKRKLSALAEEALALAQPGADLRRNGYGRRSATGSRGRPPENPPPENNGQHIIFRPPMLRPRLEEADFPLLTGCHTAGCPFVKRMGTLFCCPTCSEGGGGHCEDCEREILV